MHRRLSIERCLAAADECGAPIVSICGGEPLIYPGDRGAHRRASSAERKHVYLCTNGLLLEKKLPGLRPSGRLLINVHLDGMEATHDRIVERQGRVCRGRRRHRGRQGRRASWSAPTRPSTKTPTCTKSPCCSISSRAGRGRAHDLARLRLRVGRRGRSRRARSGSS